MYGRVAAFHPRAASFGAPANIDRHVLGGRDELDGLGSERALRHLDELLKQGGDFATARKLACLYSSLLTAGRITPTASPRWPAPLTQRPSPLRDCARNRAIRNPERALALQAENAYAVPRSPTGRPPGPAERGRA